MVAAWAGCGGSGPSCDDVVEHAVKLFVADPQNGDHALAVDKGDKTSKAYRRALRACSDGTRKEDKSPRGPLTAEEKACVMKATDDGAVDACFSDGKGGYENPLTGQGGGRGSPAR